MGASHRRKGANGEREAAAALRAQGICVTRQARNGVDGSADLAGDGIVCEVKRRNGGLTSARWLEQSCAARVNADDVAILLQREDQGAWLLTLKLADLWAFCAVADRHKCELLSDA